MECRALTPGMGARRGRFNGGQGAFHQDAEQVFTDVIPTPQSGRGISSSSASVSYEILPHSRLLGMTTDGVCQHLAGALGWKMATQGAFYISKQCLSSPNLSIG